MLHVWDSDVLHVLDSDVLQFEIVMCYMFGRHTVFGISCFITSSVFWLHSVRGIRRLAVVNVCYFRFQHFLSSSGVGQQARPN